ncbi:hypothetical protein ACFQPB_11300 [Hydrogenophaga atypica]|uniref:Uncharacterized protein n=1 Tax=Hydrogenophaga atypica TaxID=249409 RepID=A0ABW2QMN4_9BURK
MGAITVKQCCHSSVQAPRFQVIAGDKIMKKHDGIIDFVVVTSIFSPETLDVTLANGRVTSIDSSQVVALMLDD